jgi:ABC-type uncharacterized transport system involved in gliding motility auxiliary subunit
LNRLVGIIGWLGAVLVFGALAIRFLRPEWQQYATWGAWGGLVCVLLYTLGQWRDIARAFQRRQAQYGSVAALSVLVVLAILVAINYLSSRQNRRWDFTASKTYSLSDQTRQVLGQLKEPVKIVVFARELEFERFRDRLREYEYQSKQVSVEYVDADRRPALVKQYGVQAYGTVVFDYNGRIERVTSDTEQDLTNGLIKVTTGQQKKVYFVQGHGERDSAGADRTGYSNVSTALGGDNFTVEKLVLAQQGKVPADASVIAIASPNVDYFPGEIDAIRTYLAGGGKLLALIDPPEKSGVRLPNLFGLLHEWGFDLGNDIVVDASGLGRLIGTDASVPLAANYPVHAITDRFNVLTAYPLSRSVSPVSGGVNGRTPQAFIETSPNSWSETDMAKLVSEGQVELEENRGDRKGPISIAAAVSAAATAAPDAKPAVDAAQSASKPETRVIVVGDGDFASNAGLGIGGNSDMFLNMVNWLAQQDNLISVRARNPEDRRITMTAGQDRMIFWFTMLILPGLIFLAGIQTWWRRR